VTVRLHLTSKWFCLKTCLSDQKLSANVQVATIVFEKYLDDKEPAWISFLLIAYIQLIAHYHVVFLDWTHELPIDRERLQALGNLYATVNFHKEFLWQQ